MENKPKVKAYTSFRVNMQTHTKVAEHCIPKGILFGTFYENAAMEKIEKDKQDEQILQEAKNRMN